MTRVTDADLRAVRERGFAIIEGFLDDGEVARACDGLHETFPTHVEYHAEPEAYRSLTDHPFAGLRRFPFSSWELNRVAHHPDLVDAAERFCDTTDVSLYKVEAWGKYSGAADYDQLPHRDYGNHNLVVPRADGRWPQMTTFILLSDVTERSGPTKIVPRTLTGHIDLSVRRLEDNPFLDEEVSVVGPAGTLLIYTTDVFHRGSAMTGHPESRFALLADFMARGAPWMGRRAWPDTGNDEAWHAILGRATARERELFGFPPIGHEYWDAQTVADVGRRWPDIDMSPYGGGTPIPDGPDQSSGR